MTTTTRRPTKPAAPSTGDWRQAAACRGKDPDMFFAVANTPAGTAQRREAKRVCASCPVRPECLEWALETRQAAGVWGGMSARKRQTLKRPRETHLQRCLKQRAWIERQLAAGVTQKAIAGQIGVEPVMVSRAVRVFRAEQAGEVVQGVKAA